METLLSSLSRRSHLIPIINRCLGFPSFSSRILSKLEISCPGLIFSQDKMQLNPLADPKCYSKTSDENYKERSHPYLLPPFLGFNVGSKIFLRFSFSHMKTLILKLNQTSVFTVNFALRWQFYRWFVEFIKVEWESELLVSSFLFYFMRKPVYF